MNKVFAVGLFLFILIGGFFVLRGVVSNQDQIDKPVVTQDDETYQATLSGEYLCLPLMDSNIPITTDNCVGGIKTDAGEYYAVDLMLMSQIHDPLVVGENINASGVVVPLEQLSADHWQQYPIVGIFSITSMSESEPAEVEVYACTKEAKICPDGSAVGRTGPNCEFEACPVTEAASAQVTTDIGGSATALTVTVSPQEIIADSRCPQTVTCIWAGTLEVRTTLATPVSHGEHVLTLGKPQIFGEYTVTLIDSTPTKTEAPISDADYRFTYEVVKRY